MAETGVLERPIGGAPAARHRTATPVAVAAELPEGRLTSAELGRRLGVSEDWIVSRTGIRVRCQAPADQRLADCATAAGAKALAAAGISASELDLVVVATMTPDELTPNTAPLVAHALGAEQAGAFDVGSACAGFLSGLTLAAGQIESGRAQRVLLIGADFLTRITDYADRRTAPLFADAAGALVLAPAGRGPGAIGPVVLAADGSHGQTMIATHSERKLVMDGPEVFRHAVARMGEVTLAAIDRAELELGDIDLFVYHQANARIVRSLRERLRLPAERVVECIEAIGNAGAATLPVALSIAEAEGRLRPGSRVLLSAFGGGFTWGGAVIEWGGTDRG